MFEDKNFQNIFKETQEFNNMLYKFVVTSNQINMNSDLVEIYQNYDSTIRKYFQDLLKCDQTEKNKKVCINSFKEQFESLRSNTSKSIEKL